MWIMQLAWPRGRGGAPLFIGRLWQGDEAKFSGIIPYLLRRFRRLRWFRFLFCFLRAVVSRRLFCFFSGVGSLCGGFVFAKLTSFLEFCGTMANLASPVCRVWNAARVY